MFSSIRRFIPAFRPAANPFGSATNPQPLDPEFYHPDGTVRTIACGPDPGVEPWRRSMFEGAGCTIYAWPRDGVVVKDDADVVDMAFLNFDRFVPPTHRFPKDQQDREDDFARSLLRIGGKWWPNALHASQVRAGWREPLGQERECWYFGWVPKEGGGGLWALGYDFDDERIPGMAVLRMAVTMEERCALLEKLGGKFYEDPKECEGLKGVYAGPDKFT